MYNARKAFLRSKNDKNRPGWSFDINSPFVDKYDNPLPMQGASYSISMSQLNDEPTKVHVETAKTTPQGVIRHKKNFEIDRRRRTQYKPKKTSHVSWDLPQDDPVQDLKQEVEQEMKQEVETLDDSHSDHFEQQTDHSEEDIHSDDSTEEEETIYTEHVPDEDDSHSDHSADKSDDDIEEAIDIFTQKLKESGFSKAKINLVKKMLFNALD